MPRLETERLILRDFVLSDWDALNAFLSDPSVTRFMHFASWDEGKRREWLTWLILGRSRHATEEGMRECGCGYALNQHYWGQGYMPEALQATFTYAFTVLGTRLIHAECERVNTASARVMQRCGMKYEGTMYDDDGLGNWEHRYRYVITAQTEKPL
jgi:ribosomal-protein-alanine N-acetyltransferase